LLFESSEGFPNSRDKAVRALSLQPEKELMTVRLGSVPHGEYAVSILHDENDNRTLDRNFFGIPQEGYGVSRNPEPGFGPPRFEDAVFALDSGQKVVEITLLYLDEMAEEERK